VVKANSPYRKIVIISLLTVFLFNSCGYYLVFEWNRYLCRREIEESLRHPGGKMMVLVVPDDILPGEYCRLEQGEIYYKGSLYDVVSEKRTDQSTIFCCYHDKKDSLLHSGWKEAAGKLSGQTLEDPPVLFYSSLLYADLEPLRPLVSKAFHFSSGHYSTIIDCLSPPPKRA